MPHPRKSRLHGQPAPQPVHPSRQLANSHRPTFDELTAQTAKRTPEDELLSYVPETGRAERGVTETSWSGLDTAARRSIRRYFLDRPADAAALPRGLRELLAL